MSASFAGILDRRILRQMAGARSFERGEEYFASGRVRALTQHEAQVTAKVRGTREYRVELWTESDGVGYACTCPMGADGVFCKHGVAVGLACLDEATGAGKQRKPPKPVITMEDVRADLERQNKDTLVGLIMEQAMDDDRLRERLLMKTARKGPKGLDLATFRRAIDNAVDTGEFVDYRSAWDYAQGIEEVIGSIADLLKEGHANEVVELAEYFLAAVEERIGEVDDSDGHLGGILERLQELHHAACKKAKPDPEALAKRLFEWELRTQWDMFSGAAATYAGLLGTKGLTMYRKLAEAAWARVPVLGPGRDDADRYGKRFRITQIMESLAEHSGDLEALVAVKSRDLSHAYSYLQIAEIYKQARRYDQALEWGERGVKAFPSRTDSRLRDFLAEEYHRRKRHDEAMALMWAEFAESPGLEGYKKLKTHADRIAQWPAWREKALAFLRETLAGRKKDQPRDRWAWSPPADHSELVRIFLWEKDVETAWREAKAGGCFEALWMEVAAQRERSFPEDALPIYQGQIDPTVNRKNNDAYREAVGLLRKVRELMVRLGREAEFARYMETVRAAHKPKRNFMKLLEHARW
jgi:uncharacterized Zn finger protein